MAQEELEVTRFTCDRCGEIKETPCAILSDWGLLEEEGGNKWYDLCPACLGAFRAFIEPCAVEVIHKGVPYKGK